MSGDTRGRSELLGKRFRLEGFLIERHPQERHLRIQVTILSVLPDETEHVLCLSEITERMVKRHRRQLKTKLGTIVGDASVVPYVQRSISGGDLEHVKPVLEEGWPGAVFHWWEKGRNERN